MNRFKFRNRITAILLVLMILFSASGIGYGGTAASISLSLPATQQVYQPGNVVEIKGTATGLGEVGITVSDDNNKLVFAAQPKVVSGNFSTSFILDPNALGGKYTLLVSNEGVIDVKRQFIVSGSTEAKISIEKPGADKQFKPGEEVEIAGTALNVEAFTICVRNKEGGRVFLDQPYIGADGAFSTSFSLPDDTTSGQYSLNVNAFGMKDTISDAFMVTSTGTEDPSHQGGDDPQHPPVDPTEKPILTITGDGVDKTVEYTLSDLKAKAQSRAVFSVTSDLPEDLDVAAEGVTLESLLREAGLNGQARMITFEGTDGYKADFTVDELLRQSRYIFPGKKRADTLIALKRAERTTDYSKMIDSEAPILCFGQRAETEQTLFSFVKRLKTITVSTDSPAQWAMPTAKITATNSKTKASTQGGQVQSGSNVYLDCETGGKIYYTTDGSTPTLNSTIFNPHGCGPNVGKYDPIVITKNTTVKAMVVARGKADSEVATYQFTVPGSEELAKVVEQKIDESNMKKEIVDLGHGRKEEKITLLPGVMNDIGKAANGSCLMAYSTGNTDQARVEVSAESLKVAQGKGMMIGLDSQNGRYALPLNSIDLEKTAAELGTKSGSLTLNILISKMSAEDKTKLVSKIGKGQQMMSDPIEFSVEIVAPDGKKKTLSYFGGAYVERYIGVSDDANSNKAIGVVWNDEKSSFSPAPTRFETKNGKKYAVILSRTNSIYTVLQSSKVFSDITDNWAKGDIELLASKLLISGKSETEYSPKSNVTRAEFAALLVRALGLAEGTLKEGQYKDVSADAWYAGDVAAAAQENIITGYAGDLFKPDNTITREEMAVMIGRAASVAGKKAELTESEQTQLLKQLKDNPNISSWAKQDVASAVKAGIIKGMSDQSFSPGTNVDRAQSAAILKRFLVYVNFMN